MTNDLVGARVRQGGMVEKTFVGHNGWKQYHKEKRPGTRDHFETALWETLFEGEQTEKQMVLVEPMY